jgi:predicted transcriptional regulator of viral defense system
MMTTAELAAAGVSPGRLHRLARRGAWLRLAHGAFAPAELVAAEAGDPAGQHAVRVAAALAVNGPGAVASHHSAALIHALELLGRNPGETVALTRAPGATGCRTGRPGIRIHMAALPAGHVITRRGLPVTSVARTVVDLARASSFRAGVVVADFALRSRQASKADLDLCLTTCARWPGIQNARRVIAFADGRAESVLESISRVPFDDLGLPLPDLQAWVGDKDEIIGRADFLWRAYRTVGEADGALKYADPARAIAQLERDAKLRAAGFEVVHFTWRDITRTPDKVLARVKTAFGRGAAL